MKRAVSSKLRRAFFGSGAEKRQMTVFTSAEAKERRDWLSIICLMRQCSDEELLKVFAVADIQP